MACYASPQWILTSLTAVSLKQPAPGAKPTSPRDPRLDAVRGVAIVGVVLGHVIRGLMEAGLASPHVGVGLVNERVLYLIRLPLFVIVSGLLMPTSVERRGTWRFLWARVVELLWVYLLWSILQGSVEVVTSGVKNTPTTWTEVLTFWVPRAQLWYLPYLAIVSVGIALIKPWRGGWRSALGVGLGLLISVLGWGHDGITVLTRGMSLTIFLVAGAALTRPRLFRLWDSSQTSLLALVGVLSTAAAVGIGLATPATMPTSSELSEAGLHGVVLGLMGATAGVIGVSSLVVALGRVASWLQCGLALLGRHAMAIYLGHITAMAATRIALFALGVDDLWVHILLGTSIGTGASLLLVWAARFVPWLLAAPKWMMPPSTTITIGR